MTWTLAIDTSHVVAVGLAYDGAPRARVIVDDTRAHAEALMPSVLECCREAGIELSDVDEFVVGMGPGPFTGLRVGVATAWTLAHLAGREPHGVCSLDAVAVECDVDGEFVVAADARRKELYWARYAADGTRLTDPQVSAPEELPSLPVAGAIPDAYRHLFTVVGPQALDPAVMAARWRELAPAGTEPYYLRPADATVPGKPKSALPRVRARR
ncbi:MAG TPA: tRNA (adenosine(37)-N6)-threonylcarbamoyltransferase complex dimerization subunit type 1 TsaB [Tessaracoccus flavescens]|uniref:tRNA (Adenosine(37)-N6)-threonylcarbamoyltransferase complex dimerization subunit type 1 TsaB n=1 Tax=Tessaracoccus flavescens TaxID=399497 RepID=A0A921ESC9_9ACTN|nr:tRNA (adenosine(37)-N6)-threonylcarbamoyltransferase complex dimerization subunit type 1 TsaB [Tessaracoccus flavescens]